MRSENNPNYLFIILSIMAFVPNVLFGQWSQIGSNINGEASGDESSYSISLSADGQRVVIGAYLNDGNGNSSGHARVYKEIGGDWIQLGSDINGKSSGDWSGFSVSISSDGSRIAIGSNFNSDNGYAAGQVRIFEEISGTWIQVGSDILGEFSGDQFGYSLSLSADGNKLAIGAPANPNGIGAGHVRVFKEVAGSWIQIGSDIDGESPNDESGFVVSLSADGLRVAIGAHFNDGSAFDAGHVRVYQDIAGIWTQVGLDIDGVVSMDQFGHSVSLSNDGKRIAIGAIGADINGNNSGQVRIFEDNSGSWTQIGLDIDGEMAGDSSGYSVSLSSNGKRVSIGAVNNDGFAPSAGHVRIYNEIGGQWVQSNTDIDGLSSGDWSGNSVSLSADGSKLAVGARFNDGNGSNSGHTRIFGCSNILNVTDMVYHCTLEEAILSASMNDVLEIPAGIYSSQCYTIDKTLTIIASGGLLTIECLIMNGIGKNLLLGGNLTINQLTLTHGNINTNGYHLKCGTISGGSTQSYIVTD
ncbi:MAG: hypothetical protein IPL25_13100 [Saprospiraceae bacterium]|nr:hypothetical protein [Candidatus Vicinibacter affinis]